MDEQVKTNKNGVKPIVVFLLCLIFSIVFGVGGWFLGTWMADIEDKKVVLDNDKDTDINAEDNNKDNSDTKYTLLKNDKVNLTYGDKKVELSVNYYLDEENIKIDENTLTNGETDKKEVNAFVLRRELLINGNRVGDIHILCMHEIKQSAINAAESLNVFEFESFKDTKTKEDYVVLSFYTDDVLYLDNDIEFDPSSFQGGDYGAFDFDVTYILDSTGNVLKELNLRDVCGRTPGIPVTKEEVQDKYYSSDEADYVLYPDGLWLDIHDDYFYYLMYDDEEILWKEYKISINNGNVNNQLLNTYDFDHVLEAAGETC